MLKHRIWKVVIPILIVLILSAGCGGAEGPKEQAESKEGTEMEQDTSAESQLQRYEYRFRPHVIAEEYLRIYGKGIEQVFYDFSDAVLAGEESFACPSAEKFHQVLAIARNCLPVAEAFIQKDEIFVENGRGHIVYTVEKEELMAKIQAFREKITHVISSAIPYQEEDFILAMELLTALARKNTVDETISLDDMLEVRPYRAIMEDRGICQELAGEYIYYLLQLGINAIPCSALNKDQSEAHEWVMAKLGGEYYHIDPMFTVTYPDSLFFFGMNDPQRAYYGDFPAENFTYADTAVLPREEYSVTSDRFAFFWLAESYTIDHLERKITIRDVNTKETKTMDY